MNKILKKIITLALALVCALSLVACADDGDNSAETGLFCKKIGDVYTIHKYVDDGKTTTLDIAAELAKLNITDTNIRIKSQAFTGNGSLTEIIVPDSVTEIEKGAFANMKALQSLTVPFVGLNKNGDVSLGDTAPSPDKAIDSERTISHFFGDADYEEGVAQDIYFGTSGDQYVTCYMPLSFKKITVKGDNNIPACAFNGLNKYVQIVIDGNVKVVGDYAFSSVAQMTAITLPTTVEKINLGAFKNSANLETINLSDLTALTYIGESAFEGTSLTAVTTPTALETIDVKAFTNCKSLATLTLNVGLTKIAHYAFKDCVKLTTIVSTGIADDTITLGNYAFAGCEKLADANYSKDIYKAGSVNAFPN